MKGTLGAEGAFPGSTAGMHEQRIVKQQSQKEIAADILAGKIFELARLEEERKSFLAEHKKKKEKLEVEVTNQTAIIRNYVPLFEDVNKETGEIT